MDKSQVVQHHAMLLPTLEALQKLGGSASIEELNNKAIVVMGLSDEMCSVLHKENSALTAVKYRLAWARTYLKNMDSLIILPEGYGLLPNIFLTTPRNTSLAKSFQTLAKCPRKKLVKKS